MRGRGAATARAPAEQKMVGDWSPRRIADQSAIAVRASKYKNMRAFILASLESTIAKAQKQGYPLASMDDQQIKALTHDANCASARPCHALPHR